MQLKQQDTNKMDEFAQYQVLPNAGRGNVNPPLIGQPQPGGINPYLTTVGSDRLDAIKQSLKSGVVGAAHGVTAGLFDYLPAALKYGSDRITGNAQSGDWPAYLEGTRRTIGQFQQAAPKSYLAGDVAGSIGLGVATGGESLLPEAKGAVQIATTMGTQGVQGATRKYTENADTTALDALKAGGVSAAIPGALSGAGKVTGKLADQLKLMYGKQVATALDTAAQTKGSPLTADETVAIQQNILDTLSKSSLVKSMPGAAWNEIKSTIIPTTIGAIVGGARTFGATKLKVLGQAANTVGAATGRQLLEHNGQILNQVPIVAASATQPEVTSTMSNLTQSPTSVSADDFEQYKVSSPDQPAQVQTPPTDEFEQYKVK